MKHSIAETAEIAAWTLLGVLAAFVMAAHGVGEVAGEEIPFSPAGMFVYILVAIGVGAVLTVVMLRNWTKLPSFVQYVLAMLGVVAIVGVWGRVMARGAYGVVGAASPSLLATIIFGIVFFAVVIALRSQAFWGITTRVNTVLMLCALGVVSVTVAEVLTPFWVVALMLAISVYDFVAVRMLKTMQEMALGMAKGGFIPAITIPKAATRAELKASEGRKPMALLGGGDVFIISTAGLVMTQAYGVGGIIVTSCMFGAVVWLLCIAKPKKFYPAVPYIFAGLLVGMTGLWFFKLM